MCAAFIAVTFRRITPDRIKYRDTGTAMNDNHSPLTIKRFPWLVCSRCGYVFLRNQRPGPCRGYFREHITVGARTP